MVLHFFSFSTGDLLPPQTSLSKETVDTWLSPEATAVARLG